MIELVEIYIPASLGSQEVEVVEVGVYRVQTFSADLVFILSLKLARASESRSRVVCELWVEFEHADDADVFSSTRPTCQRHWGENGGGQNFNLARDSHSYKIISCGIFELRARQ